MRLGSLPKDSSVFIDANVFLFTILAHPRFKDSCERFLISVEKREYNSFTSALVLNEVIHKLMLTEVVKKYGLKTEHEAYALMRQRPEVIKGLTITWGDFSNLKTYPITIVSTGNSYLDDAVEIAKTYGLLISDAVHAATCREHEIENVATNDADFERVDFLKVWKP